MGLTNHSLYGGLDSHLHVVSAGNLQDPHRPLKSKEESLACWWVSIVDSILTPPLEELGTGKAAPSSKSKVVGSNPTTSTGTVKEEGPGEGLVLIRVFYSLI